MLVHFPIAIVTIGFLFELVALVIKKEIYLGKMSFYLLLLGTFFALVAVLTGTFFTTDLTGAAAEVQSTHETFAFLTLGLLIITSLLRIILLAKPGNNILKWFSFIFYLFAALSVSATGFFGGSLVYNYMLHI